MLHKRTQNKTEPSIYIYISKGKNRLEFGSSVHRWPFPAVHREIVLPQMRSIASSRWKNPPLQLISIYSGGVLTSLPLAFSSDLDLYHRQLWIHKEHQWWDVIPDSLWVLCAWLCNTCIASTYLRSFCLGCHALQINSPWIHLQHVVFWKTISAIK